MDVLSCSVVVFSKDKDLIAPDDIYHVSWAEANGRLIAKNCRRP